jgi:hypothetical protein
MFNRGDYFQDFCPYQTRGEMLFVFCFLFLISYLCPLSYQMLHYTLGPGERRLYGSRLDFPFLFFLLFRFLSYGFKIDILHSNYRCIPMSMLITCFSYLIRNAMQTLNNYAKNK